APMRPARALPTTLETEFAIESEESTTKPATTQSVNRPPSTGPAIGSEEPLVRLPLRELIQRAVANSSDVKVAGYQPAIDQTRVTEAQARFDPTFFTNVQYAVDNILAPSPQNIGLNPASGETTFRTYSAQVGVRQELESGGKVELRYEPSQSKRSPGDF